MFNHFQEVESFFVERKSLGIKPGLDRVKELLRLLGNPQDMLKAIHIAGTNGKGSTLSFLKNALQANGYHVGVFTSPSFFGLTGYMFKDDQAIPEDVFVEICNRIYPFIIQLDNRDMAPTEFEIITAVAFVYFTRQTDIVLVEAGMGGREDTTNCFQPILSIITNVDRDHTAFLGHRLEDIAYHKAGVIKQGSPVIIGDMDEAALEVINEEVRLKRTKSYQLGNEFIYKEFKNGHSFLFTHADDQIEADVSMYGEHQVKNASIALMTLLLLKQVGYKLDMERSCVGLRRTQVPGRFEVVREQPMIILDGAHNPAGVQAFLNTVSQSFANQEKHLIFAAFKDKDLKTMQGQLQRQFSSIIFTSFDHPRAAQVADLKAAGGKKNNEYQPDWHHVIEYILTQKSGNYFITGSLHFITEVRKYLNV
ncbi:dihydrofolate synthase/folylpolyglutamate synthase [Virgibacillus halotolerans]|uniref:bifunctional folylpolyglutamate synthase/dihydrofolate synthase n=1 Tax=Virgibacillus halotolerans TaxID=1071053 RepID=UPI00196010FC|nr:folylpolyglutamate synthase/dihydrofolate synthase family protein [Virgibacillus halotolerans]MBM7597807.1 dihydrofolate synthase/folylpolyglutamate synthase [Virgibacillus halotolerans]